jgi:probable F420-dependent oxidoreductase
MAAELAGAGYTDLWSSEVDAWDAIAPLAAVAAAAPHAILGTAIVPVHTRGPAVIAQTAATMAGLTGGRFVLGIGSSAPAIVRDWNAVPHDAPYQRVKDTLSFLREALTGARVDRRYETFEVRGFQLRVPVPAPPPVYVAALRPGMLRLAAEHADGTITNWLGVDDVLRVRSVVGPDLPVVARIMVAATQDLDAVRAHARRLIAGYLTVPTYAAFQTWLGRGPALAEMWTRWHAGDRRGALAAVPDEVVDDLVVHGSPEQIRAHIGRYVDAGVTVPVLYLLPLGDELREAALALAAPGAQSPGGEGAGLAGEP